MRDRNVYTPRIGEPPERNTFAHVCDLHVGTRSLDAARAEQYTICVFDSDRSKKYVPVYELLNNAETRDVPKIVHRRTDIRIGNVCGGATGGECIFQKY